MEFGPLGTPGEERVQPTVTHAPVTNDEVEVRWGIGWIRDRHRHLDHDRNEAQSKQAAHKEVESTYDMSGRTAEQLDCQPEPHENHAKLHGSRIPGVPDRSKVSPWTDRGADDIDRFSRANLMGERIGMLVRHLGRADLCTPNLEVDCASQKALGCFRRQ